MLQVAFLGFAEYAQEFDIGAEVGFLDLFFHERANESNRSDVVSGVGFHSHNVSNLERDIGGIAVESLAGVLESNLHKFVVVEFAGDVGEPVKRVVFTARSLAAVAGVRIEVAAPHNTRILEVVILVLTEILQFYFFIVVFNHPVISYLAKLTARVSRITVILTCPG